MDFDFDVYFLDFDSSLCFLDFGFDNQFFDFGSSSWLLDFNSIHQEQKIYACIWCIFQGCNVKPFF